MIRTPLTVERWSDKQGNKGISIKDGGGLNIANMVGQLDDSELEQTREIVRRANCHEELLEACKVSLSYLGKGVADGLFSKCAVSGERLLTNLQMTIARAEGRA